MPLEGITKSYSLTPLKLSPRQLLLDPTNPRLITDSSQMRKYTTQSLVSPETQRYVLDLVCRKEHGVQHLIASIRDKGFITGHQDIIVKAVGQSDVYLVLEGNRRTAALQHLLEHGGKLRDDVLKSVDPISVKKFSYIANAKYDEDQVIDVLLGSIHIDGPMEWSALARAQYVYRSYQREFGTRRSLVYDVEIARRVGGHFGMSAKTVQKCLTVARVYEQLQRARLAAKPDHFTLIDLATKTRAVATEYFELDVSTCELSDVGLERFAELCLGENAPVHNPGLFSDFVCIKTEGTELELSDVVAGQRDVEAVAAGIRTRMKRRAFREDIAEIRQRLGDLNINHFRGTEGEKEEIRKLKRDVDEKLLPLTRRS